MRDSEVTLRELHAALERESRINIHRFPIHVGFRGDILTLEGEVETLAAKKLALECAAAMAGGAALDDRLSVRPAEAMEDADLYDLVFNALTGESAFDDTALMARAGRMEKNWRGTPRGSASFIEVDVENGVITLAGQVESYAHKALAGALVWWRGTRDVVNGLEVEHAMDDPDGEMTDALRMLLEKDRFVHAAQIRARCRDFTATLDGAVKSAAEKAMAEADAWFLIGVNDVVNRLVVLQ